MYDRNLVEDFDRRHQQEGRAFEDRLILYYPDGARRDYNPMGALWEPPEDPLQRAKLVHHYWATVRKAAVEAFDEYRNNVRATVNAGNYPCESEVTAKLKALQKVALDAKAKLDAAEQALNDATPSHLRPEANTGAEEYRRHMTAVIDAIEV